MKWVRRVLSWLGFAGFTLWRVAKGVWANGPGKSLFDLPDFTLFRALSQWRTGSDLAPGVIRVVVGFTVGLAFVISSLSGLARWRVDATVNTVAALRIVGLGGALAQSGDWRPPSVVELDGG